MVRGAEVGIVNGGGGGRGRDSQWWGPEVEVGIVRGPEVGIVNGGAQR